MVNVNTLLNRQVRYEKGVPVLNRDEIDWISAGVLRRYMPNALTIPGPVDIESLMENHFDLRLDFQSCSPDGSILGETIFVDGCRVIYHVDETSGVPQEECISVKKGMIILDSAMVDQQTSRTAFTEAHELGHWILHDSFYGSNEKRACRSFLRQRQYFPHHKQMTPIEWTEWQANTFAAALLLLKNALRITLKTFLKCNGLTWETLSNFSQYKKRLKYDEFLHTVAKTSDVSPETARLRMNKLCKIDYPN